MFSSSFRWTSNGFSKRHRTTNATNGSRPSNNRSSPVFRTSSRPKRHARPRSVDRPWPITRPFKRSNRSQETVSVPIVNKSVRRDEILLRSRENQRFRSDVGVPQSRCSDLYGMRLVTSQSRHTRLACSIVGLGRMAVRRAEVSRLSPSRFFFSRSDLVQVMHSIGNKQVNTIWEANKKNRTKPQPNSSS